MNKRLYMMAEGTVNKSLIYLSVPTIVGLLITGFYNLVDSYFVAKLGTEAMSAISVVYPLLTLVPGIGLLFGNGGSAFISELLGAKKKEKAEEVLATTFFICLFFSFLLQLILFKLPQLLVFLGASENVLPISLDYSYILILSFIFHIPSVCLMNLVRAEGALKLSTLSQVLGAVLNIILDPIFIFYFNWGIKGAAIATSISQFISFSILLLYYLTNKSYLKLSLNNIKIKLWILKPTLKVGIPLFAINFFQSFSLSATNIVAAPYGDNLVASLGIANRVVGLSTFVVTGFSRGYQTFISYNYGAKRMDRVKDATKKAFTWGIGGGLVLTFLQIILSSSIVKAFSKDINVIDLGIKSLFGASLFFFLYGFQAIAIVYLLCIKYSKEGFLFSIARQGLIFLPVLFIDKIFFGVSGIIFAQGISDIITTMFIILFLYKIHN